MAMHNPPHPGEFIQATYIEPFGLSCRYFAKQLNVAASTLNRVLKKQSGISPDMALRLSKTLGRSPKSWLTMQNAHDSWQATKNANLEEVHKITLDAAQIARYADKVNLFPGDSSFSRFKPSA